MSLNDAAFVDLRRTPRNRVRRFALAILLVFACAYAHGVKAQEVRVSVSAAPTASAVPVAPPPTRSGPAVVTTVVAPPAVATAAPEGQWVFTRQYGWVYMPYAQRYTYVPTGGQSAMYVYRPSAGWRWVAAPWVVGVGPLPYWGPTGYVHFAWYARPWFACPVGYRHGHYARVYVRR
jgi:hypothetical protein